jgi:N-acyl amino acid synthase of PEP-CTERM/exosortase system
MQSAFELRYEIYCVECRYLPADAYPAKQETDAYDEDSSHFFCRNVRDELVGYVRLVEADADGLFPWQLHAPRLLNGAVLPPPSQTAEISRLMVRADYRRRRGDTVAGLTMADFTPTHRPDLPERRSASPQVLLELYRQMYQHSLANDIKYWYAAMERPLARALRQMGFNFHQVSHETDYYGPVSGYVAELRRLEEHLARHNPGLLAWFQRPDLQIS